MNGNLSEFIDIILNLNGISAPDVFALRIPYAVSAILLSSFLALLLHFLAGNKVKNFTPAWWRLLNNVIGALEGKLNRPNRGESTLVFRGGVLTILCVLLSCGIGAFLEKSLSHAQTYLAGSDYEFSFLSAYAADLLLVLFIVPTLFAGGLWWSSYILAKGIGRKSESLGETGVYYALSQSTRLNLTLADDYTLIRLNILFMIRAFDKMLVVPIFWYLIGGLPLLYAYSGLAYMRWRLGKEGMPHGFGRFAQRLERIFGFIPSMVTCIIILLAVFFTPKASFLRAIRGVYASKQGHFSPYAQGGRPVTIASWALNMSLGGAFIDYDGANIKYKWVGTDKSTARLEPAYLRRSLYLMAVSLLILVLILVMMI